MNGLGADPRPLQAGDKLDICSAMELAEMLKDAVQQGQGVVVDLEGSRTIHAAALQLLVAASRLCATSARSFRLTGVSSEVANVLRLTGLDHVFGLGGPEL